MLLIVSPCGVITTIYTDDFPLPEIGATSIERASDVEPDVNGGWTADLRRSGGPILGPFDRRSQALEAEVAWLELHLEKLSTRRGR